MILGLTLHRQQTSGLKGNRDRFFGPNVLKGKLTFCTKTHRSNDAMLDRDEVAVAQITGRPVTRLAEIVVGIELDKALAPFA